MEFNTTAVNWTVNSDGSWLMLKVPWANQVASRFEPGKEYVLTAEEYHPKRSLDANRYMWQLCGKIAEKLSSEKQLYSKEEIYRKAIQESGVWYDDEVPVDKVKWRCTAWELIGTGWFTERVDFTHDGEQEIIRFYYGSSRYNTKQMSRLIDNIVQECRALDIETLPPEKIAVMIDDWGKPKDV